MIRAIIVDDERHCREFLATLIENNTKEVQIIGEAKSVEEAILLIKEGLPELVFLDIEMPKRSGFQLFNAIDKIDFEVIFTTAHSQYAIDAIRKSAIDYLLKPIEPEELVHAVKKVANKLKSHQSKSDLADLLDVIRTQNQQTQRIPLATLEGLIMVDLDKVVYIKAETSYSRFCLSEGQDILVSKGISEYENSIMSKSFIRIHKSHIINLNYLAKYIKGRGGSVVLNDGTILGVSATRKQRFMKALNDL